MKILTILEYFKKYVYNDQLYTFIMSKLEDVCNKIQHFYIKYEFVLIWILNFLQYVIFIIFILLTIAFFTLLERKVMSSIQRRRGPNRVGFFGVLQPFADGLKLLLKELIYTSNSNTVIFFIAPVFTFICTLTSWLLIPLSSEHYLIDLPFSLLILLAISSLSVHGIIFSGWSSNSKYAFLGGIRSASQMISYEISISTIYLSVVLITGSFSLVDIVEAQQSIWFCIPLFPLWILFIVSALAETNRAPFDLPEAEAELVAGYNVEYSAIAFALFFLAEYGNIILMSTISTLLFLGGWQFPYTFENWYVSNIILAIKISSQMFIFLWVRAAFPRYRYDQLMKIGWTFLIPITFTYIMLEISIILTFTI